MKKHFFINKLYVSEYAALFLVGKVLGNVLVPQIEMDRSYFKSSQEG